MFAYLAIAIVLPVPLVALWRFVRWWPTVGAP